MVNKYFEKFISVLKKPQKTFQDKTIPAKSGKNYEISNGGESFSIRNIAAELCVSPTTIWKILQYDCESRTESHMEILRQFSAWILEKPEDFLQRIFWTDEKLFFYTKDPIARIMVNMSKEIVLNMLKLTVKRS